MSYTMPNGRQASRRYQREREKLLRERETCRDCKAQADRMAREGRWNDGQWVCLPVRAARRFAPYREDGADDKTRAAIVSDILRRLATEVRNNIDRARYAYLPQNAERYATDAGGWAQVAASVYLDQPEAVRRRLRGAVRNG